MQTTAASRGVPRDRRARPCARLCVPSSRSDDRWQSLGSQAALWRRTPSLRGSPSPRTARNRSIAVAGDARGRCGSRQTSDKSRACACLRRPGLVQLSRRHYSRGLVYGRGRSLNPRRYQRWSPYSPDIEPTVVPGGTRAPPGVGVTHPRSPLTAVLLQDASRICVSLPEVDHVSSHDGCLRYYTHLRLEPTKKPPGAGPGGSVSIRARRSPRQPGRSASCRS